ncbi:MAG TPA: alcohol dehydrogenase catalytic domain-containing protein, partial [Longimicrobium sp.]|nr:alcohol dehydrogenase catalytic domain-containing protein [Longimicrobium sp.]
MSWAAAGVQRGRPGAPLVIDGTEVETVRWTCDAPEPRPELSHASRMVCVRVDALSCNYRDKAFIAGAPPAQAGRAAGIGSEFCGTVVWAGHAATAVAAGDRVMGQNHYTGGGFEEEGVREGIPTNSASEGFLILHERKLVRVPDAMPTDVAAAFTLGAQTAYSMARRLSVPPGAAVLVTSGRSNTSLFLIPALRSLGARVFATTTSGDCAERLM